jgi:ribosomal protein S6--L-glutamate ligase
MGEEIKRNNQNEVLLLSRKPDIYSTRRLVEELRARQLPFRIEDPETSSIGSPAVIIPRLGTWRFFETIEKLTPLASQYRFLNSPDSYLRSRNKWIAMELLAKNGVPTPTSQLVHREDFSFLEFDYPFVLKDIFSSQGLGVFLINSAQEWKSALSQKSSAEDFLVQNYVRECHGEDLRIVVTSKGDYWGMKRKNLSGDFRSNLNTGGKAFAEKPSSEEVELSFKALKIFGLDYAGVDILRSDEGPLFIEVNPCPGFQGIESIHGKVIAGGVVDLFMSLTNPLMRLSK